MFILLLSIPFAVLTIAIAVVPLLVGMKFQAREEVRLAVEDRKFAAEFAIESHQFELAA